MDKLDKINANIRKKQMGRITIGSLGLISGLVLIGQYIHQKGATDYQKALSKTFPDGYSKLTEEVLEFLNK